MMKRELIVSISPGPFGVELYIGEALGEKFSVARPVELVFEEVSKEIVCEPTLKMNTFFAMELFRALAEAMDKEGIKTDKDAKIEGTLEATRYHLEDLRKLLELK